MCESSLALENVLGLNHELQNVPVVIQQSCINRSIVLKNVSVGHMLVVKTSRFVTLESNVHVNYA